MRVTPWPVVDERGRLRFPRREEGFEIGADATRFAALVWRLAGRVENPLLRAGDVFAAALRRPDEITQDSDLADYVEGPVYEVSEDARETAKAQYLAAVGTVLTEDELAELYRDKLAFFEEQDDG
jgi:hypothetical protein